jgi:hypothetical protein
METSQYFQKAIYLEQSPAAADYFEERTASLFVTDSLQSWLEVFTKNVSSREDDEILKSAGNLVTLDVIDDRLAPQSNQSQTAANGEQHDKHNGFAIEPGLDLHRISLKEDLQRFVKARSNAAHSRSTKS